MKKKVRLGKKTKGGYTYATTVNLGRNLTTQIEELIKEKDVKDLLKKEVDKLSELVEGFEDKEKASNTFYYHVVGKSLKFLEKKTFKRVGRWSVFRVVHETLPEMLPHISDTSVASKHIAAMFYLGKVSKRDLPRATWAQWYEIVKFPKLFTSKRLYKKILTQIKGKEISGPQLRSLIPKKWRGN